MSDLKRCKCVDGMTCHFCGVKLEEQVDTESDEYAWCDWVVKGDLHVLAHAYCAEGQPEVERG